MSKRLSYQSTNTPIHTNEKSSKKMKTALNRENLMDDLKLICLCETQCVEQFRIKDVISARVVYHSKNEVEKLQWLIDLLSTFYNVENNEISLLVLGRLVCRDAFLVYYGISQYKFYVALNRIKNENLVVVHGNSLRDYKKSLHDLCYTYLQKIVENFGDKQPDSDEVHLPSHCLKSDIYEEFINSIKDTMIQDDFPSYRTFRQVWEDSFSHLKIPKKNRMGICDLCVKLSNEKDTLTRLTHSSWQRKRKLHIKNVFDERQENYRRIAFSQTYPNMITLIGIDRMNAIRIPWQMPFPKSWLTKSRPRYEVISLVDFGNNQNEIYHGLNCFPHDSDATMTLLYFKLRELRENGKITPKLQLHMDNCFRENKNRFVFAFCIMLIYHGWYSMIEIFFLPPGHTHAENDALFVPLAKGKWKTNCHSPKHFTDYFVPKCYQRYKTNQIPTYKDITYLYSWKNWLEPHIRNIKHHSIYRAFQFKKVSDGVEMFYKTSSLDNSWIGYHSTYGVQLMSSYPNNIPNILPPFLLPSDDLKDIPSMYEFMDDTNKHWWESFLLDQTITHPSQEIMEEFNLNFWVTDVVNIPEVQITEDIQIPPPLI